LVAALPYIVEVLTASVIKFNASFQTQLYIHISVHALVMLTVEAYYTRSTLYIQCTTMYGRAATNVRRCPPEGVAGLSKLRGCPREGVVGRVMEGFPPLGKSINRREGRDTYLVQRNSLYVAMWHVICTFI